MISLLDPDFQKYVFWAVISFIGGALGYIMRKLDTDEKLGIFNVVMEGLSAAFLGVIIAVVCVKSGLSTEWIYSIVAFLAWAGSRAAASYLEAFFRRKFNIGAEGDKNEPN
ncbi:holin [Providencia phage PSTCR4]|uniref:Holin n=2 Tax=Craquatrovirus TaxID=3044694 RepID=A0A7S9SW64_9CAUD|nr:holin [Providencia phage PSTCR4]YP_010675300.1 holin [Providencia phage PSTCR7]QPB12036.1 hypothetical protein [Providencia phage PSTCR4]QPI18513.1 hypothetical protein [Providencia phage PSTCR7]